MKQDENTSLTSTERLLWRSCVNVCVCKARQKLTTHTGRPSKRRLKWNYIDISVYSKYKHDNTLLQPFLLFPNTHHSCFALSPTLPRFLSLSLPLWNKGGIHGHTLKQGVGGWRGAEVTGVCVRQARLWGQKHHFVKLHRRPSLTLTALEKSRVLVSPRPAPDSTDPQASTPPPKPTFSCP